MEILFDEKERTEELVECLKAFGLFESEAEAEARRRVVEAVDEVGQRWIRELGQRKRVRHADKCAVKLFPYGSYRFGVQSRGDDIDMLLVAPKCATRDDFFDSFLAALGRLDGIGFVCVVRQAAVPLIKTSLNGIAIDVAFATLPLATVPAELELGRDQLLKGLDEPSARSLSGPRLTDDILRHAGSPDSFRLALQAIKLWAKRRGIYSQTMGYLGGASWALLVAYVAKQHPRAPAATVLSRFFITFANWSWREPVLLKPLGMDLGSPIFTPKHLIRWQRRRMSAKPEYNLMPIVGPTFPEQNTSFRVTKSAKNIIIAELVRGHEIADLITANALPWPKLFEPVDFFDQFRTFIIITVSPQPQWVALLENKIREFILDLDELFMVKLAQAYPKSFDSPQPGNPNVSWFVGVRIAPDYSVDDLAATARSFRNRLEGLAMYYLHDYPLESLVMRIEFASREHLAALNVVDPKLLQPRRAS